MIEAARSFGPSNGHGPSRPELEERRLQVFQTAVTRLVENAIYTRREIIRKWMDPRRDIDDECGYPKTSEMDASKYRELWEREPVAARVIELMPRECWCVSPLVYEEEDSETVTPFEEAWDELGKSLRSGTKGWYKQEKGSPVWEYLRRADEMSGIGSYGVLLLGFDDLLVDQWEKPVKKKKGRKLLYVRPLDETLASVTQWETDTTSPRFGLPSQYSITFASPYDSSQASGLGSPENVTKTVHWTRVIHIADNLASSESFGVPRCRPVLNPLLDIRKVRGSSGEMYYKGAFPGLSAETHPQLGGDVSIDIDKLKDAQEQFWNGLQRTMASTGMHMNMLAPTVVDPTPQIEVQIDSICIKLSCPKRIFVGSERGELASSQDERAWKGRVTDRQNGYLTPRVIVPFVDRLIEVGVLPEPSDGYCVEWPNIYSLSDTEKAAVGLQRTQAITTYAEHAGDSVVEPMDFFTRLLGYSEEEAQAMVDTKAETADEEDRSDSPLLGLVGGMTGAIAMFTAAKDLAISEEQLKQLLMLFFKLTEEQADNIIADGLPEPPEPPAAPALPMKVGEGQALIHPETGATIGKGPPKTFPPKAPVKNRRVLETNFDPSQQRDDDGKWTAGGGMGRSAAAQVHDKASAVTEVQRRVDEVGFEEGSSLRDRVWVRGAETEDEQTMAFKTQDGSKFVMHAIDARVYKLKGVEVTFEDQGGSTAITGKAGARTAAEVFRTSSAAITALANHDAPQLMYFSAREPSRHRLYDHLVRSVSKVNPDYVAVSVKGKNTMSKTYFVVRRDVAEKTIEKIRAYPDRVTETLVNRGDK